MPGAREVAETGSAGFVFAAAGWIVYQLRRVTSDTESRAGRTIDGLEAEIGELRDEVRSCHEDRDAQGRRIAQMERALILADIPIPD